MLKKATLGLDITRMGDEKRTLYAADMGSNLSTVKQSDPTYAWV